MSVDRLTILWQKYLANELSPAELTEFKTLGADPAHQQKLEELTLSVFEHQHFVATHTAGDKELIFQQVMQKANHEPLPAKQIRPVYRMLRRASVAAIILLAIGSWRWFAQREAKPPAVVTITTADIAPGKDGAILTLANGSQVSLDSIKNGVVALQNGATAKVVNGSLVYETTGTDWVYNTVSTPRGRHFHVTLPDGSEVWLNSVSSIRYPTTFTGNKREVTITGEAYFEVKKDAHKPFHVKTASQDVEVLGTHFNVNAYSNEASVKTTLLEGAVKVRAEAGSGKLENSVILKPGEQAVMSDSHSPFTIHHSPNIEQVMAWKNGVFNFEDVNLKDAMRLLERWYDIDVVYEGAVPDIYFTGKMSKDINLSGVLKLLEDAKVHFRMEGDRRLVVTR